MEKRIKILYLLTSITLALLFVVQCLWLYSQYAVGLEQYGDDTAQIVEQVVESERKNRMKQDEYASNGVKAVVAMSNNIAFEKGSTTTFDIAMADTTFNFEIGGNIPQEQLMDAPMRFILDEQAPLQTEVIDSLLLLEGVKSKTTKIKRDSMVWTSARTIEKGVLRVEIPYDNLQGECVVVESDIPVSQVVARMGRTLVISLLLTLLLVYCFAYQIRTIQRQRKIDEVRRDFLHTMIHELKRPISTLKMCVSSLRNERLMQSEEFKEQVLQSSYNELDNLTAYFSKLRDITMAQSDAVPLNLVQVHLPEIIEETVAKTPIPNGRQVDLVVQSTEPVTIMADKMHLQNILHNLIEKLD